MFLTQARCLQFSAAGHFVGMDGDGTEKTELLQQAAATCMSPMLAGERDRFQFADGVVPVFWPLYATNDLRFLQFL